MAGSGVTVPKSECNARELNRTFSVQRRVIVTGWASAISITRRSVRSRPAVGGRAVSVLIVGVHLLDVEVDVVEIGRV